jgi:hypothetical protein
MRDPPSTPLGNIGHGGASRGLWSSEGLFNSTLESDLLRWITLLIILWKSPWDGVRSIPKLSRTTTEEPPRSTAPAPAARRAPQRVNGTATNPTAIPPPFNADSVDHVYQVMVPAASGLGTLHPDPPHSSV